MKEDGQSNIDQRRTDLNQVRINKETGLIVCPECGQLYNEGCRNCFHSRFRGEDPFNFNPEAIEQK